jgi:hypothetical protein
MMDGLREKDEKDCSHREDGLARTAETETAEAEREAERERQRE